MQKSQAQASRVSHAFSFFLFARVISFFLSSLLLPFSPLLPLLPLVGLRHLSLGNERLPTAVAPGVRRVKFSRRGGGKTNPHLPKKEVSGRCPLPLAAPTPPRCLFLADFNSLLPGAAEELEVVGPEGAAAATAASFLGLLTSGEQTRHRHAV